MSNPEESMDKNRKEGGRWSGKAGEFGVGDIYNTFLGGTSMLLTLEDGHQSCELEVTTIELPEPVCSKKKSKTRQQRSEVVVNVLPTKLGKSDWHAKNLVTLIRGRQTPKETMRSLGRDKEQNKNGTQNSNHRTIFPHRLPDNLHLREMESVSQPNLSPLFFGTFVILNPVQTEIFV